MNIPLQKAFDAAGGPTALAALLGEKQSTVSNWKLRGRVPAEKCPDVERLTGVRCEELRPDVDWAYLRGTASSEKEAA